MARKRVIAYFMHEEEEAAAANLLDNVEGTQSYLVGEIEEDRIDELKQNRLIVEELPDPPAHPSRLGELLREPPRARFLSAEEGRPGGLEPVAAAVVPEPGVPAPHLVVTRGPLLEQWKAALLQRGVEIQGRIAPEAYRTAITPEQARDLRDLPFVARVRPLGFSDERPPLPERPMAAPPAPEVRQWMVLDLGLAAPEQRESLSSWLASQEDVAVVGEGRRKLRVRVREGAPALAELRRRPEVERVDPFVEPGLHNDRARVLIGLDGPNPAASLPQTGRGEIVGVADTGLDDTHPDFNRIRGVVARGRPNDSSDPNGHGTHVAGSILGDGSGSNQQIRGVAPEAELFFQSIMDGAGRLGGLPVDLNDLFDEAYQQGARIHNNSWGAATGSRYTANSIEVDEFVHDHPDMLVIISAGNEGVASANLNANPGFVDWLSIGSPASSKNALTVGASRSDRTMGGYSRLTYGQVWPRDYPDPPVSSENVSGDSESLAAFSSRGPCDDRRIKPDLVAPGTDIASAKSARAPLRHFWGAYPGFRGRYAYMGGTSMAAPIVSGCAALVRQYYAQDRGHDPSAALVKATLVNGTRWLGGRGAVANYSLPPNFHQGFGCVHLPWMLPNDGEPDLQLEFLDTWQDPSRQFTQTGQRERFIVTAGSARELRFCLTWTDLPARALQNNLDLFVQYLGGNRPKWMGNQDLPQSLGIPDPDNTIEVIRIQSPDPGDYLIQIAASNLLGAPQAFGLVVTGDLQSPIHPY